MSNSHKAVLAQANAAIRKRDFEGFLKFCTEDTVWIFVGDKTLRGKAEVRNWMEESYREPPDFDVHTMVGGDGHVVAIGEITVTDSTGKAVRHKYCDIWRFEGELMAELQAFVV